MDVIQAHRLVLKTNEEQIITRDYQNTCKVTNEFIKCVNNELENKK